MAYAYLDTPPDHDPDSTPRISTWNLHNVITSSTALQSHLGLNNPTPYALPPLPPSLPNAPQLDLYARLHTHATVAAHTTTSVRILTFVDTTPSMTDPDVRRNELLKRLVVGVGGVREMGFGTVFVPSLDDGEGEGEGEGGKWVFVTMRWGPGVCEGDEEGSGKRRRSGRRMCFALPERGVERLEGVGNDRRDEVEMGGSLYFFFAFSFWAPFHNKHWANPGIVSSDLLDIDPTEIASFSVLFSRGGVPVFEFGAVDEIVGEEAEMRDGGEDECVDECECECEGEAKGVGDEWGAFWPEEEDDSWGDEWPVDEAEDGGEVEEEAEAEVENVDETEEEWTSVKRAMAMGGCLVGFYV